MVIKFPPQQRGENGQLFSSQKTGSWKMCESPPRQRDLQLHKRERSWKYNKGRNTASQMSILQCLIPADTSQCKENDTGREYLLQLPLPFNLEWILKHEHWHFGVMPLQMRSETQHLGLILYETDGKLRPLYTILDKMGFTREWMYKLALLERSLLTGREWVWGGMKFIRPKPPARASSEVPGSG